MFNTLNCGLPIRNANFSRFPVLFWRKLSDAAFSFTCRVVNSNAHTQSLNIYRFMFVMVLRNINSIYFSSTTLIRCANFVNRTYSIFRILFDWWKSIHICDFSHNWSWKAFESNCAVDICYSLWFCVARKTSNEWAILFYLLPFLLVVCFFFVRI